MDKNHIEAEEKEAKERAENFPLWKFKKMTNKEKKHVKVIFQGKKIEAWKYLDTVCARIRVMQLKYDNFVLSTGISVDLPPKITEKDVKSTWNSEAIAGIDALLLTVKERGVILQKAYDLEVSRFNHKNNEE